MVQGVAEEPGSGTINAHESGATRFSDLSNGASLPYESLPETIRLG